MRVVFLTHYFVPEVGAPQSRIAGLARGLTTRGFEIVVHAPPPHYPAGRVLAPYRNRLVQREDLDGLRVVRSAVLPAANRGFALRIANHLSFGASAIATAPASGRADAVVVETPPLFTAAAAVLYARLKRVPLVVNVSDRWPASAVELGALTDRRAIAAAETLERWIYRHAAAVTTPTEGLVAELGALPDAAGKVHRTPPAVDLARFAHIEPPDADAGRPLRVLYAGTVGLAQGVADLVEAAASAGPHAVEVRIAGGGAELPDVTDRVQALGATNVELLGVLPAAEIPTHYEWADVGAVLLRDRPLFEGALPTKMLEAMAAARPVLLAARGEAPRLIERTGSGVVVAPEDSHALAAAITDLATDRSRLPVLGAAARAAAAEFSREAQLDRWAGILRGVIGA